MRFGLRKTSDILAITGKVLPVTTQDITVCAKLENGMIVEGENNIPLEVRNRVNRIEKVYINPTNCAPIPEVLEVIKEADCIILGPGSLYTSVMPNLLVRNVSNAIKESNAMKVYICNIMTQSGETDNYTVGDHIEALQKHFGKDIVDFCICDSGKITPEFVKKYNLGGAEPVIVDYDKIKEQEVSIIEEDLAYIKDGYIRHDPQALGKTIMELVCEDFKLRNKQNLTEYAMLRYKLKIENDKLRKQTDKKNRAKEKVQQDKLDYKPKLIGKKESKFTEKYRQRIESIKNSSK